ncbi:HAMP domain-containing protein [Candidatus Parcubacteria bacterium]|nr:HAMP domain-containing protein [Candidatus Parcubacteria bacterium]
MPNLSFKIAWTVIVAGSFVIISYIALNYQNLNTGFYMVSSFLVVYVFLFGFAIGQNFTAPVRKLLKRADELSKGDLKSRFYLESKDELGQLAQVFNHIADQLEESKAKSEKMEQSVGLKVEAQTQSLRETIDALEKKVQNRTLEFQKMSKDLERFKEMAKKPALKPPTDPQEPPQEA